jgi:hypothetical protein
MDLIVGSDLRSLAILGERNSAIIHEHKYESSPIRNSNSSSCSLNWMFPSPRVDGLIENGLAVDIDVLDIAMIE